MGLFDKFKTRKIESQPGVIYAPMDGRVMVLEEIPDPVFSAGVIGPGCGMEPVNGEVAAPFNGKIVSIAETKHAIGMVSDDGIELLIHVGMDTVQMNGDGFDVKVSVGDKISCGQLLMKFSTEKIKNAGYSTVTAIIVANAGNFKTIEFVPTEHIEKTKQIGVVK